MQGIRPSEDEKKSIGELVELFNKSIKQASQQGENLLSKLGGSFLSVDDSTIKILRKKQNELLSAMWKLNVKLYEMRDFPERIIEYKNDQNEGEWDDF
jgi:hypothetical protein